MIRDWNPRGGKYPSDLTNAQRRRRKHLIPARRGRCQTVVSPRREVIHAILYVLLRGCQWRMLPHDFPPWKTVDQTFYRWRLRGVWSRIRIRSDAVRNSRQENSQRPLPA